MKITLKNNSPTRISLIISADEFDLTPIKNHVLGHFKDVKVPGFRAGRAPAHLIEKHIDQQRLYDEFIEHALNDLWRKAIDEKKLRPAGQPKVEIKKFIPYTLLEFEAEQDVIGEVTLPSYKTMKLARLKVEVSTKELADVLKSLQARSAARKPSDIAAAKGDEVIIDFSGSDESGQPIAGTDGKDYSLVLGSGAFIPGFEENLVGIQTAETKEFQVTFPKDYAVTTMQGKKVTFKVAIKAVNKLVEPELNDEFAQTVGPFSSVAELRADIKKQLIADKTLQAQRDYEGELVKKIADRSKVDVPAAMIDEQISSMEDEEKRNLIYRGQTWDEHLKVEGITEEKHRERQRPEAESRVKAGLVLSAISEKEGIDVSSEELNSRIAVLKQQYSDPAMQAELDKPENRQDIAARILTEKTVAKLSEYASS